MYKFSGLIRIPTFCCIFAFSTLASAQTQVETDYLSLIAEYVNKIDNIYDGSWAFTYILDDKIDMESRTVRRDTSLPFLESETLLAVDGMPPTEERLIEHAERRERALRRRQKNENRPVEDEEEGNEKDRFIESIIPESVHLIKQEDEMLYLGFQAYEEENEKIYENLQGVLILDTDAEFIKELQVSVVEPFYPVLLVKVESGYVSVRFDLFNGTPMQSEISFQLEGQAFFVRDIAEDREIVWTDFERISAHP